MCCVSNVNNVFLKNPHRALSPIELVYNVVFDLYCSLRDTLIIKQMGACNEESVKKAVKEVPSAEGRIDVLCSLNGVKLESISKGSFVLNSSGYDITTYHCLVFLKK